MKGYNTWVYSSFDDHFKPLELSWDAFQSYMGSPARLVQLLYKIAATFLPGEPVRFNWAYLDEGSKEYAVLRCRVEFDSSAGELFLICVKEPLPLDNQTFNFLGRIVKRHKLISVIPKELLA